MQGKCKYPIETKVNDKFNEIIKVKEIKINIPCMQLFVIKTLVVYIVT